MKVYYAHSVSLYGTKQEARDIVLLQAFGFEVTNPNMPAHSAGYEQRGMSYFWDVLDQCDALAFRANPGSSINAGVFNEVQYMLTKNRPVIELPTFSGRQLLTIEDTRQYLKEVGAR